MLDLYAGSGQLGIEALSRGAARCVFLDENREAVNIVMRNCKTCGVFDRSRVNVGEAARYLSACRSSSTWCCWIRRSGRYAGKDPAGGGQVHRTRRHCAVRERNGPCAAGTGGGLTLQKQYKYGKVLLWKYTKPMQQEGEAR